MKDLSRERIAELRHECETSPEEVVHFTQAEFLALCDMASRSVSEETVRKLAAAIRLDGERFAALQLDQHAKASMLSYDAYTKQAAFAEGCRRDLKEAAEARGRKG